MRCAFDYRIGTRKLPLVVGLGLILAGALILAGYGPTQPLIPTGAPVSSAAAAGPSRSAAPTLPAATRDPRTPIPDGYRLQIPRLKIDLPITEGNLVRDIDQAHTPEGYAFHLTGTAIPGEVSNSYFYAHARVGMFLTLWNAKVGDEIFISTPDLRLLKYVVSEVRPKVPPTDTSVVQPTASERITLQTSTGPNPGDPRFVVVAVPAT